MVNSARKKGAGINRITTRMLLVVTGVVLAAILLSYSLIFLINRAHVRSYVIESLLESAESIARIESGNSAQTWDEEQMAFYEELTGATIMYMDVTVLEVQSEYATGDGLKEVIRFDTTPDSGDGKSIYIWDTLEQYDFNRILDGYTVSGIKAFTFSNEKDIIIAGAPIKDEDGKVTGGVVLVQETTSIDTQMNNLMNIMVITAVMSLVIAAMVSFISGRRLSKPIIQITAGAQRMTDGQYGEMIQNRNTGTELDVLAGTLNTLSWKLSDSFNTLTQEQEKLNLILDALNEGIVAVDWYMNVIHCNHPFLEMLAYCATPEKIDTDGDMGSALFDCMRSRSTLTRKWIGADGRHLMLTASPFYGNGSLIIGAVGIVVDVSESERMEQLRKDYVANISHELRTPLTGIRGMVEPLMDGIFETEAERQGCYGVIYQETLHLEKLIGDMLDMSRLQDGRIVIEKERLVVNEILNFAAQRVLKTAQDAGIEIRRNIPDRDIECIGNEERILQVATIFLDNAMNFTPSGGSIDINVCSRKDDVYISVKDTGCGIEPKDIPYIWERFYKSDKSRMRTPGTGLGLAIAKLVVELMDGEIGVNSTSGNGAEFWFTLKK